MSRTGFVADDVEEPDGYLAVGDGHWIKPFYVVRCERGPSEHCSVIHAEPDFHEWGYPYPEKPDGALCLGSATILHRDGDGRWCTGHVNFSNSLTHHGTEWSVENADPEHLTMSPSILCDCGDHGFIRDGKWVRA